LAVQLNIWGGVAISVEKKHEDPDQPVFPIGRGFIYVVLGLGDIKHKVGCHSFQ
jgi:hypothetical protein